MERDKTPNYREEAYQSAQRRHEQRRHEAANPPPRRSKPGRRGPRRILGLWARLAMLVVFIGVLGIMAVRLVAKIIHPYSEAGTQTRQLSASWQQLAMLDEDNTSLRQKIADLRTPSGITREARKMGYVRPGEIPFVVEGQMPSSSLNVPTALPAAVAPAPGRAARFWHHLTGH